MKKDETQIFVVPQDEFISWIYGEKNYEKKEIILYEKPPEELKSRYVKSQKTGSILTYLLKCI